MKSPGCALCQGALAPWRGPGNVFLCPACGVAQRHPLSSISELDALYGSGYYESWGNKEAYWDQKRALYRRLLSLAPRPRRGLRVLDVGCATGACLSVVLESGDTAFGMDVNPSAVRAAKANAPGATVVLSDLESAPFADGFFDVVVLSDVLEHLLVPQKALGRVRALLAPGGAAVILTPDIGSLSCRAMGRAWIHYKDEHLFYFSQKSLSMVLKRAGFTAISFYPAQKPVSLNYALTQFSSYPVPLFSRAFQALGRVAPKFLRARVFSISMGEMCAVAYK